MTKRRDERQLKRFMREAVAKLKRETGDHVFDTANAACVEGGQWDHPNGVDPYEGWPVWTRPENLKPELARLAKIKRDFEIAVGIRKEDECA